MIEKKKILLGNWKMNKTVDETLEYLVYFNELYNKIKDENELKEIEKNVEYGLAMPFTSLVMYDVANKVKNLKLAAQNVDYHLEGAYTGQISAKMLQDLDVSYTILGHSERRQYYYETNELVNKKAKILSEYNIIPVICVGETLEQFEAGKTKEVIEKQIAEAIKDLDFKKIVIAYEPIWAIGTGKTATPQQAQEICKYIHHLTSKHLKVLYGGSVKVDNIEELNDQNDIDGFLVGGASLDPQDFVDLLTKMN